MLARTVSRFAKSSRARALELSRCLTQLYLVGRRVYFEEQITLVDDIAICEADPTERAADLGAHLNHIPGGELAHELEPGVDVALHGHADRHTRRGRRGSRAGGRHQEARTRKDASGDKLNIVKEMPHTLTLGFGER